jgi:hypothetical protein
MKTRHISSTLILVVLLLSIQGYAYEPGDLFPYPKVDIPFDSFDAHISTKVNTAPDGTMSLEENFIATIVPGPKSDFDLATDVVIIVFHKIPIPDGIVDTDVKEADGVFVWNSGAFDKLGKNRFRSSDKSNFSFLLVDPVDNFVLANLTNLIDRIKAMIGQRREGNETDYAYNISASQDDWWTGTWGVKRADISIFIDGSISTHGGVEAPIYQGAAEYGGEVKVSESE